MELKSEKWILFELISSREVVVMAIDISLKTQNWPDGIFNTIDQIIISRIESKVMEKESRFIGPHLFSFFF
jgi:hypothetical protein